MASAAPVADGPAGSEQEAVPMPLSCIVATVDAVDEFVQHICQNKLRHTHPRLPVSASEDSFLLLDAESTSRGPSLAPLSRRCWATIATIALLLALTLISTWMCFIADPSVESRWWSLSSSWFALCSMPALFMSTLSFVGFSIEAAIFGALDNNSHPNRRPFLSAMLKTCLWQPLGSYPTVSDGVDEVYHAVIILSHNAHWTRQLFVKLMELCRALAPNLGDSSKSNLVMYTAMCVNGRLFRLLVSTLLCRSLLWSLVLAKELLAAAVAGVSENGIQGFASSSVENARDWLAAPSELNRLHVLGSFAAGVCALRFATHVLLPSLQAEFRPGSTAHLLALQWTREQLLLHVGLSLLWQVASHMYGLSVQSVLMVGYCHYLVSVLAAVVCEWAGLMQKRDLAFTQAGHAPAARPWTVWMRVWQDSAGRGHLAGSAICAICQDSLGNPQKPTSPAGVGIIDAAMDWLASPQAKRLPVRGWQFDGSVVQLLSCGHAFHAPCVLAHEKSLPHWPARCPTCRAPYSSVPLALAPLGQACPSTVDQTCAQLQDVAAAVLTELSIAAANAQMYVAMHNVMHAAKRLAERLGSSNLLAGFSAEQRAAIESVASPAAVGVSRRIQAVRQALIDTIAGNSPNTAAVQQRLTHVALEHEKRDAHRLLSNLALPLDITLSALGSTPSAGTASSAAPAASTSASAVEGMLATHVAGIVEAARSSAYASAGAAVGTTAASAPARHARSSTRVQATGNSAQQPLPAAPASSAMGEMNADAAATTRRRPTRQGSRSAR